MRQSLEGLADGLIRSIEDAARTRPVMLPMSHAKEKTSAPPATVLKTTDRIVTLGCSTGGTQALEFILRQLPRDCPGIVIVQHMPEKFTADFARRLNSLCQIEVREARHLDRVHSGLALLAPGGLHMQLKRSGAHYLVEVLDGPAVNRHKPSVDVLFRSAARVLGPNALGVMLTGMGADGAQAMREMKDAGSYNYVQDEASCVVFGMPRMAIQFGAAHEILPLNQIASALLNKLAASPSSVRHRI